MFQLKSDFQSQSIFKIDPNPLKTLHNELNAYRTSPNYYPQKSITDNYCLTSPNINKTHYYTTNSSPSKQHHPGSLNTYVRRLQKYKIINHKHHKNIVYAYTNKEKEEDFYTNKMNKVIQKELQLENPKNHLTSYSRQDPNKPEGYIYYDFIVKNPILMKSDLLVNKFDKVLPQTHQIKEKNIKSGIFDPFIFKNQKSIFELKTDKQKNEIVKQIGSDVLNTKAWNPLLKDKYEEQFLFNPNKQKSTAWYNTRSNSDWAPKIPLIPSKMNHSKVGFNIISPSKQSIVAGGDQQIAEQNHRWKSISEFVDWSRVSAPNVSEYYKEQIKGSNANGFRANNELCSNHWDCYHSYNNWITKPFNKESIA